MSDNNNNVNWSTVGAAWALSTLTTIICVFIVFGVRIYKRFRHKRQQFQRAPARVFIEAKTDGRCARESLASRQVLINTTRQNSTSSDAGPITKAILPSRRNKPQPFDNSTGPGNQTDFTSRWCTEHGLSEQTAAAFRSEGFNSQATIDSLTLDIIPSIGLYSKGQECLLRKVLTHLRAASTSRDSAASPSPFVSPRLSSVTERPHSNHLSSSEEALPCSAEPRVSPAAMPLLVKTKSLKQLDDSSHMIIGAPLRKKSALDEMNTSSPGVFVFDEDKLFLLNVSKNQKGFNGLLSDKGLYVISHMLGLEWLHLATMLEIPNPVQDQIRMDNPNSTKQQIFEMLRLWRDTEGGTKEQIKGTLYAALLRVARNDIADKLMQEQVEGSQEGVAYSSII